MSINSILCRASACIFFVSFSTLSNAALLGRLPATPGGTDYQAYYDDQLNITWAADANINGLVDTWANQNAWAASLDINGVTGWRLPNMDVNGDQIVLSCVGGATVGCEDNEMGFLYWEEGITVSTPGVFSNIQFDYWSATEHAAFALDAYNFSFDHGFNNRFDKNFNLLFAWAVHSGDVSAVPVPAAVWLFGSGLISLIGFARYKVCKNLASNF